MSSLFFLALPEDQARNTLDYEAAREHNTITLQYQNFDRDKNFSGAFRKSITLTVLFTWSGRTGKLLLKFWDLIGLSSEPFITWTLSWPQKSIDL